MSTTRTTRSSFRIAKLPPPPSSPSLFLSLPPETIDLILTFATAQSPSAHHRRLQLAKYLSIHPSLTPIVRRRLYYKTSLILGDPRGRSDKKLVELLELVEAGKYVNFVRVRLPDPEPTKEEDLEEDPALSILPAPRLDQKETVEMVVNAFEKIKGLRYLELEARAGTRVEGEQVPEGGDDKIYGGRARLEKLGASMMEWSSTLETFIYNLADPYQRLQIFSDASIDYESPFVRAIQSWDSLTQLELWRVQLKLCPDLRQPNFRLKTLRLRDVELSGSFELDWLVKRSTVLSNLVLENLVFTSTPASSSPLLDIFSPGPSPSFANSLKNLELELPYPVGEPCPPNVLSSLVNLEHLLLGGEGVDLSLFSSIFPSLSPSNSSLETPFPSQNLQTLSLHYLIHPSFLYSDYGPPLDTIQPRSFHNVLFTHLLTPRSVPKLRSITLQPTGEFPRQFTWAQRRGVPLPSWKLATATTYGDESDAWFELESPLRKVNRQRRRENLQRGGTEGELGPIKLLKNRLEIDYADDLSDGEGGDQEEEEEEIFDGDALFEPPSSDEEAPVVNTRREPDSDSDF
ncbi:hypothetical protein JCM5350_007817 [Sporobolomyces pararoseus]